MTGVVHLCRFAIMCVTISLINLNLESFYKIEQESFYKIEHVVVFLNTLC